MDYLTGKQSFLLSLNLLFYSHLKNPALSCYKIQVARKNLRFTENWAGPIVCYLNKYTIKSISLKGFNSGTKSKT